MAETEGEVFRPPYLAFATFWNFIDELSEHSLPPVIDRSLMGGKSGTDQANLLAALRAFGLIDEERNVLPLMNELVVKDVDARKAVMRRLILEQYATPLAVSGENGTEQQLTDSFRTSFNMDAAETRRKSITFFLHAARVTGIALSPYFPQTRTGSGNPGQGKPRSKPRKKPPSPPGDPAGAKSDTPPTDYEIVVQLKTGGVMRLTVDVNPLTLVGSDRDFFFKVVDWLTGYDSANKDGPSEEGPSGQPSGDGGVVTTP